jgi:hypothetical protein
MMMLRYAVTGLLVGMGVLAGCEGVSDPGAGTAEQALGTFCDKKMPPIVNWDGSMPQAAGPTSVFVIFPYAAKQQANSATAEGKTLIVADVSEDKGDVNTATSVNDEDPKFAELAQYLIRYERVRVPGDPPDPCVTQPWLCAGWLAGIAVYGGQAELKANEEFASCPLK